jgi:hypothetical protein
MATGRIVEVEGRQILFINFLRTSLKIEILKIRNFNKALKHIPHTNIFPRA